MSGEQRKKDPPMYEGKYGEDIELWIFATEQYYASRRELMEADTSDFVTMISSNLGKSVLNWYRAFIAECEGTNVQPTWSLFKGRLRTRFRPKDFEYDLRERMFRLKQNETIHDYVSKFQDLLSQTELSISELEKRFFFQNAILEAEAQAFKTDDQKRPVTIFIDNGSSLNGVTEELVKKLELDVTEGDMIQVDLGYDQVVHRPRRTVEMSLQLPGFPLTTGTFQVMPVPEGKDIVLGMMWLREQNPDIDWNTGQIAPRIKVENTQTVKLRLPKTRPARWVAGQRRARVAQDPWPQRPVWANEDYFVQTVPADVA
ncbi:hypothetical protein P3T76_011820 [Phytophthora citrophthora]|uniref:Retrotransposon gag domain-containing protein n=1 Tax=Phytophthora citrophthora TaxID=4793 RepID=A0AAD9LEV3_9STRA|nr:hypothetical protein P3T76_011820 [Phytophthora citrophthora]